MLYYYLYVAIALMFAEHCITFVEKKKLLKFLKLLGDTMCLNLPFLYNFIKTYQSVISYKTFRIKETLKYTFNQFYDKI